MDRVLNRFAWILRQRGVRISPAETIDALRALGVVSVKNREAFKVALSATLVKSERDLPIFEEEFERFFRLEVLLPGEESDKNGEQTEIVDSDISVEGFDPERDGSGNDVLTDFVDMFEEEKLKQSAQTHQDEDDTAFSALSEQLVLNAAQEAIDKAMEELKTQINVSRITNPGQLGSLATGDPSGTMDMELDLGVMEQLKEDLENLDLDEDLVDKLRARISGDIDRLPELLQKYLEKLMAQRLDGGDQDRELKPAYKMLFTEEEREQMESLIRRLSRKFHAVLSNRRDSSHRGRINIARTMRSNLKYQGIPFRPVYSNRKEDRPRLVVLADVSLSVRNTSRFALHLVHNLQSFFSNVRTFAFVADIEEVTEYFDTCELEEVLGMIFGGEILDVDANSNYGIALEQFYQGFLSSVNQRTTVLILGDGRGNGNPPNAWVLEEINRRARQLIWFTPELERHWEMGGGDMPTYAELCDRVEVVRSLDQFDEVVDDMVVGAMAIK